MARCDNNFAFFATTLTEYTENIPIKRFDLNPEVLISDNNYNQMARWLIYYSMGQKSIKMCEGISITISGAIV